jgi:hypothetical protein
MKSHETGFPPFPYSLEIPSIFPRPRRLDICLLVPLNSNHPAQSTDKIGPHPPQTSPAFKMSATRLLRPVMPANRSGVGPRRYEPTISISHTRGKCTDSITCLFELGDQVKSSRQLLLTVLLPIPRCRSMALKSPFLSIGHQEVDVRPTGIPYQLW